MIIDKTLWGIKEKFSRRQTKYQNPYNSQSFLNLPIFKKVDCSEYQDCGYYGYTTEYEVLRLIFLVIL